MHERALSSKCEFWYRSMACEKLLEQKRREFVNAFINQCQPQSHETILDIGVSGEEHPASNMLEKLLPHSERITALGTGDHRELEQFYPGLHYVRGDRRRLPFAECSFDLVHSHAVIEHIGTREQQYKFLAESSRRGGQKGLFSSQPSTAAIPLISTRGYALALTSS